MNVENQCCTHAQAYTLRQLCIWASPLFIHRPCPSPSNPKYHEIRTTASYVAEGYTSRTPNTYPAYTAAELAEMLPSSVYDGEISYDLTVSKNDQGGGWLASYDQYEPRPSHGVFQGKAVYEETMAQALATLLIWLLEQQHYTADAANEALNFNY